MEFVLNLEYGQYAPLFRRLSDALRKAILDGRLQPGDPVPSVRDLSSTMGIARGTVLRAYADLQAQGYIESISGSASFVSRKLPGDLGDVPVSRTAHVPASVPPWQQVELSAYGKRTVQLVGAHRDLREHYSQINYGGPPLELSPLAQWKKLLLHYCQFRQIDHAAFSIEPFGYRPLRESLVAYLHRFRSVRCDSDRLSVFGTKQLALDAILSLLLDPGQYVAFEEPGFVDARIQIESFGAKIIPIPVDDEGIDVDCLISRPERIRLIYVTPSHQDPTGAVLSMNRRLRLLDWARSTGAFIIEDDYDSEFRYGSKPLPSLQGLDQDDCVIYLGSLWKTLFQVLRVCYVAMPQCLREGVLLAKMQTERHLPVPEQLALTDMMNSGALELHVKRVRPVYARRRQALIYALTKALGSELNLLPESGGMHVVIRLGDKLPEQAVLQSAYTAGIEIMSTAPYYSGTAVGGEFMLSFANVDPDKIEAQVRTWLSSLKKRTG